jgi:hypothetical protein
VIDTLRAWSPVAILLAGLLLYVTAASVYEASGRPFWYDEVFTVVLSGLPSMTDVHRALATAADTSAPGFYVIQRATSDLVAEPEVGFRLASIAALPIVSICLYLFARTHLDATSALVAAVTPLLSLLYHDYSVEARPYALAAAFLSMAMLAWQRLQTAWGAAALGCSLAAAVWVNYHAVFALGPFIAAESVRTFVTSRVRWSVWMALTAGAAPLVVYWENLSELRRYYGDHYWTKGSIADIIAGYDWFFELRDIGGAGFLLAMALVLVLVVAACRPAASLAQRVPLATLALIAGFIVLPWAVMLGGLAMGGGFTPRYGIGVIGGLSLGLAYASRFLSPRAPAAIVAVLLLSLGVREVRFWMGAPDSSPLTTADLARHDRMLARAPAGTLPVVVSNGLLFVPLAYYRRNRSTSRLVALIDTEAALQYSGTDSVDLDLAVLRRYFDARIEDYDAFVARHDRFLLYSSPGRADWWPGRLRDEGYQLDVVARDGGLTLYDVSKPGPGGEATGRHQGGRRDPSGPLRDDTHARAYGRKQALAPHAKRVGRAGKLEAMPRANERG